MQNIFSHVMQIMYMCHTYSETHKGMHMNTASAIANSELSRKC